MEPSLSNPRQEPLGTENEQGLVLSQEERENDQEYLQEDTKTSLLIERAPINLETISNIFEKYSSYLQLPPKTEKLIPDIELNIEETTKQQALFLISLFSLFQKLMILLEFLSHENESEPSPMWLTGSITFIVGPILLRLLKGWFRKSEIAAYLLYGTMVSITASFFSDGMYFFEKGNILQPIWLGGLAGDLALLHGSLNKKKQFLRSREFVAETLLIYALLMFCFKDFNNVFNDMGWFAWVLRCMLMGVFPALTSAKQVLIIKERFIEVDRPLKIGEWSYYALMGRYEALVRQIMLIYSKYLTEE